MTPINQMKIIHIVAFAGTKRFICWRDGRWDHTGSQISAAMFANRKAAEKAAKHFGEQTKIISMAYTFPNLFDDMKST